MNGHNDLARCVFDALDWLAGSFDGGTNPAPSSMAIAMLCVFLRRRDATNDDDDADVKPE